VETEVGKGDLAGAVRPFAAGDEAAVVGVVEGGDRDRGAEQGRGGGQPRLLRNDGQEGGVLLVVAVCVDDDDLDGTIQVPIGGHGRPP
jgi:hypothetical protein